MNAVRILLLEDDPEDASLVRQYLEGLRRPLAITHVQTGQEYQIQIDGRLEFDLILSDNTLPKYDGIQALHLAAAKRPGVPFIFVSGTIGEERAIQCLTEGARDFVLKHAMAKLVPAVMRALSERDQERERAEAERRVREQAALLDVAPDLIFTADMDRRLKFINRTAAHRLGISLDAAQEGTSLDEYPELARIMSAEAKAAVLSQGSWAGEITLTDSTGRTIDVESRQTLVRDPAGNPTGIFFINTDITDKKRMEAELDRAQRLETIGSIAGGIAHDLNNILTPILMGLSHLESSVPDEDRGVLQVMLDSGRRGAELVRSILTFSKGTAAARFSPTVVIREISRLVEMTFPKSVSISLSIPNEGLWTLEGRSTDLYQILMNLCVNSRDAMPGGGTITIEAGNVALGAPGSRGRSAGSSPGFVKLTVRDTGGGIPDHLMNKIFEPFFSTKPPGQGTGLGLPMVHRLVKSWGGTMDVHNHPGEGATFEIFLPAGAEPSETPMTPEGEAARKPAHTILLVEDDNTVGEITKTILETFGYRVILAGDGGRAIFEFTRNMQDIGLVLMDLALPVVDGMGVLSAVRNLSKDVKIIVGTGSDFALEGTDAELVRRETVLRKPYGADQLLECIRTLLHPSGGT